MGLRAALSKKYWRVHKGASTKARPQRKEAVDAMRRVGISERRACVQVDIGRGTYRYQGKGAADEPVVRGLIRELARIRPRFGSPRLSVLVRRELGAVNHKRVERIYVQEELQLPRRRKGRRRGVGRVVPLAALTGPNQRWSLDFVQDSTVGGRRIRALTLIFDDGGPVHPGVSGD